jgi:hypothetical protein
VTARSISGASRTLTGLTSTPIDAAADWMAGELTGPGRYASRRTAARAAPARDAGEIERAIDTVAAKPALSCRSRHCNIIDPLLHHNNTERYSHEGAIRGLAIRLLLRPHRRWEAGRVEGDGGVHAFHQLRRMVVR